MTGRILRIVRGGQGHGFIRDTDGREVFFGRADLLGIPFSDLAVAHPVAFELIEDRVSGTRGIHVRTVEKKS